MASFEINFAVTADAELEIDTWSFKGSDEVGLQFGPVTCRIPRSAAKQLRKLLKLEIAFCESA